MKIKLSEIEKQEFSYLIKILSSAVNKTEPPLPYEGIRWNYLLRYATKCSVDSIVSNVLLGLPEEHLSDSEILKKLNDYKNAELYIDGILDYEIETILKTFEKYKIKNIPLKGYFMKKEYPRSDFRSVSDFDILFNRDQLDDVKKAFSEIGYEFDHYDDNQYHFQKKPYVYVEMHATLVHEWELYFQYLADQIDRSNKRDGYNYSYEMSCEDYYLYMLVHNSNHFRAGGLGIRMILDTYVYYQNHKADFDMTYLNERLKLYKLDLFEKRIRDIAYNWFSKETPKITFDDFETYICLSATLGRVNAGIMIRSQNSIKSAKKTGKKKTKISYLISSLCPPKSKMIYNYPYLEKFPFLLPVSWISKWFKRFFVYKNVHIKQGLKNRLSYTDEEVKYIEGLLEEVGFNEF